MMIFWFILLAVVIYFIVQKNNENKEPHQRNNYSSQKNDFKIEPQDSAEEIARQRYAQGEITKAEFEEIIENLRK